MRERGERRVRKGESHGRFGLRSFFFLFVCFAYFATTHYRLSVGSLEGVLTYVSLRFFPDTES